MILTLGPTRPGAPASPGTPCGGGKKELGVRPGGCWGSCSPPLQPGDAWEEGKMGPYLISGFAALSGGTWWPGQPLGGESSGVSTAATRPPGTGARGHPRA